ncbi:hypothetical protein, partial [Kingella kingae]|uniref:hypothetical protein n=1 Tax=Kingella kingae TaxID=504 RepID=UPI0025524B99
QKHRGVTQPENNENQSFPTSAKIGFLMRVKSQQSSLHLNCHFHQPRLGEPKCLLIQHSKSNKI